jgi:hypothetical protein
MVQRTAQQPICLKQNVIKFRSDTECDTGSKNSFLGLIQNGLGIKSEFKNLERKL